MFAALGSGLGTLFMHLHLPKLQEVTSLLSGLLGAPPTLLLHMKGALASLKQEPLLSPWLSTAPELLLLPPVCGPFARHST